MSVCDGRQTKWRPGGGASDLRSTICGHLALYFVECLRDQHPPTLAERARAKRAICAINASIKFNFGTQIVQRYGDGLWRPRKRVVVVAEFVCSKSLEVRGSCQLK